MDLNYSIKMTPAIWLATGFILMCLEIIIPGFVIFWFGIGAALTSLVVWTSLIATQQWQWAFFFLSSLLMVTLWFGYFKKFFVKETVDQYRDPSLITLKGKVIKDIKPGIPGEVELFELYHGIKIWKADSDSEILSGDEIIVEEASGIKLKVKKNK